MAKKMFDRIDWDSVIDASSNGYKYCTVIFDDDPDKGHPYGEVRGDRDKKYVYLHRAILEKKLGRYLLPSEQADHEDGNKKNNKPSNIILKDLGEHQKDHALNRGNHFWKKSPMNKKKRKRKKMALRVAQTFLSGL